MKKIWGITLLLILITIISVPFYVSDPETKTLNEATRQNLPGSFIKLSDGVTHYQVEGPQQAPVVVLVHGYSEPYYVWDKNYDVLVKNGFRVLRYDLYGRGFSDRPHVSYDANLYVRQLQELLNALNIRKPINIIGVSMGGPIVAQFTVTYPARVHRIVLFDPAGLPKAISWKRKLLKMPLLGDYFMRVDGNRMLKPDGSDFAHPENFPNWQNQFTPQTQYQGFRYAILSTIRHFDFYNMQTVFETLATLHKPILLLWGQQDKVIPFAMHEQFQRILPHAIFYSVPESGHMSNYEGEKFVNPILLKFLKSNH